MEGYVRGVWSDDAHDRGHGDEPEVPGAVLGSGNQHTLQLPSGLLAWGGAVFAGGSDWSGWRVKYFCLCGR